MCRTFRWWHLVAFFFLSFSWSVIFFTNFNQNTLPSCRCCQNLIRYQTALLSISIRKGIALTEFPFSSAWASHFLIQISNLFDQIPAIWKFTRTFLFCMCFWFQFYCSFFFKNLKTMCVCIYLSFKPPSSSEFPFIRIYLTFLCHFKFLSLSHKLNIQVINKSIFFWNNCKL